jgi:hypothetical protein
MTAMTPLQKMDRIVYATGIDRIIFRKFTPHRLRWTPLLPIAGLIAGYVMMARAGNAVAPLLAGTGVFYGAFLVALLLRIFGPRMTPTIDEPLDERELMVKARASAVSGIILTTLAMAFCFYMAGAAPLGWWQPRRPNDWLALGFGLQACYMLLPTWVASWLLPGAPADDED